MTLKVINILKFHLPVKGLLVLLGATCLLVSQSSDYSYANLNTYVISYLRANDPSITYGDWIFVSQAKALLGGGLAPLSGEVSRRIGVKLTIIIGSLLLTGGYLLTYLALDWGLWACVFTIGVSHGFAFALVYPVTVMTTIKWFALSQRGSMGSIAVAGYGFGSVIWNPLETAFVNPNNVSPVESDDDSGKYFEDENVLSRVPYMFLLLGGCFFILQIVGFFLVREPNEQQTEQILALDSSEDREKVMAALNRYSVHPKNVLKIFHFWKIYASLFSMSMLSSLMSSYQKSFAQNYIDDDAYFAMVAALQQVMNGCSRIIWGFLHDVMGFRFCVFVISCYCTANVFSFGNLAFLEPDSTGARFFYGFWTVSLFLFLPGSYACYPPALSKAFGAQYASTNYGIIFTAAVGYSLLLIGIAQFAESISPIYIFLMTGGFGVVGMIMIFLFPENIDSEVYRDKFGDAEIESSDESSSSSSSSDEDEQDDKSYISRSISSLSSTISSHEDKAIF